MAFPFLGPLARLFGLASNRRPATVATGLANYVPGQGLWSVPPGSRFDYLREAGDLRKNAVVSICVRWVTRQMLQAELKVGIKNADDEYEEAENHPLPKLLTKRPNPFQTARNFWSGLLGDYLPYGNAYLPMGRANGGRGLFAELYWAPSGKVQIVTTGNVNRPIDYYRYYNNRGWEDWYPEDLCHLLDNPDPDNPVVGLGAIREQVRNVASLNAGENWNGSTLRNGHGGTMLSPKEGRMPLETMLAEQADESEYNAALRRLKRGLQGDLAGGMEVALLALEAQKIGFSPEEMQADTILDRPEALVVAAFGLNAMALDLPASRNAKTYANKAEARREAWEHCVIPVGDDIVDQLGSKLLPEFGDWRIGGTIYPADEMVLYWDRDRVPALREDMDARVNRASTYFTSGLGPLERALQMADLDPPEDGDERAKLYFGEPTPTELARQQAQYEQFAGTGTPAGTDEEAPPTGPPARPPSPPKPKAPPKPEGAP